MTWKTGGLRGSKQKAQSSTSRGTAPSLVADFSPLLLFASILSIPCVLMFLQWRNYVDLVLVASILSLDICGEPESDLLGGLVTWAFQCILLGRPYSPLSAASCLSFAQRVSKWANHTWVSPLGWVYVQRRSQFWKPFEMFYPFWEPFRRFRSNFSLFFRVFFFFNGYVPPPHQFSFYKFQILFKF